MLERSNLRQVSQQGSNSASVGIKDKIINLQKTSRNLKQYIIETDVALKSPNMEYRQSILQTTFHNQKNEFYQFSTQYKSLLPEQRKPYQAMFRKFKQKINQHRQQIRLAVQEPDQHKKKLQSIRKVWFENQETEEEEWKFLLRGFLGLFGAVLFHFLIGAISDWPIINPYVTSFYKNGSDPNLITKKDSFVSPLAMLCTGLTMKWGLKQCNKFGPTKILLIAVLGMAALVFTAPLFDQFIQFVTLNNFLYGLCAGVLFLCPMKECHKYFPKYKLICNSVIVMGTGLGTVFFGVVKFTCMNPQRASPLDTGYFSGEKAYIANRLPQCWQQRDSILILIIGILASICFYPMVVYNSRQEEIRLQKGQLVDFQNSCYTDEQALKSQVFWVLATLAVFSSLGNFFMNMNYKNLVKAEKDPIFKNDNFLVMVLVSGAVCGALFRLIWGLIFRKIGFKYTLVTVILIDLVNYSIFLVATLNQFIYTILFSLHAIAQGGYMVVFPNVCLLVFGDIIGESIYGFYWATFALSSFLQYLLGSNIAEVGEFLKSHVNQHWVFQNPYKIAFYPFIICGVIAVILTIVTKFQGRWQNSLKLLTLKCQ